MLDFTVYGVGNGLIWIGSVYGVKKQVDASRIPILGLSWGFTIDNKKVKPLKPQALGQRDWLKDLGALSSVFEGWKGKKSPFTAQAQQ